MISHWPHPSTVIPEGDTSCSVHVGWQGKMTRGPVSSKSNSQQDVTEPTVEPVADNDSTWRCPLAGNLQTHTGYQYRDICSASISSCKNYHILANYDNWNHLKSQTVTTGENLSVLGHITVMRWCDLSFRTERRLSVGLSVCHSLEPCKAAERIEMPFGLWTRVRPGNHVLDGGPDPHAKGQF